MTTKGLLKGYFLPLKGKQDYIVGHVFDGKFNNINLNQNQKCSNVNPIITKSFSTEKKKFQNNYDLIDKNDSQTTKNQRSWENSKMPLNYLNVNHDFEGKKELKDTNTTNNSTLSLHISAYENSNETPKFDSFGHRNIDSKRNKSDLNKQLFSHSNSIIENPFEFPRQQNDNKRESEVMEFKANQRLYDPNRSNGSINIQITNRTVSTSSSRMPRFSNSNTAVSERVNIQGRRMDMKRHNSDNNRFNAGGGGPKRYRVDPYNEALADGKFELRLLIPNKAAGAVIGKGGENIKAVREKYDASLTVPDKNSPERVLGMIVRLDRIVDCFTDVLAKLAEEQRREKTTDLDVRMLVHHSHAGAIIGRGGSKIKELREQTRSQIKVHQECCPNSTDRVVQINTSQENMPNVIKALIDFMREIPIKGPQKPYDSACYDPRIAFAYGSYAIEHHPGNSGGGGRGPRGMPGPPPPHMESYRMPMPPMGGPGPAMDYGQPRYPPPPMPGGPMGMMGAGMQQTQVQVTIPNELGGTIIGKGGERINRIRQQSGARIEIAPSVGSEDRVITIIGTQPQIQAAQYMLQQSVRNSEAGRRYMQHEQPR